MARSDRRDKFQNLAIRGLLGLALAVPYRWRVPMMGWAVARIVAPLAGWPARIRANLAHVLPDLPEAEVARLVRWVPDNAGRTLIEAYSSTEFKQRVADTPITGPGAEALWQARDAGRPIIAVSGHFGNYDAPRSVLAQKGLVVGGLYREMKNPYFNAHYVKALAAVTEPIFPTTRRGITDYVAYLEAGNTIGLLIDIFAEKGVPATFFGQPAPTAASAAEWALKYDAVVVPVYGVRQPDGLSFEIVVDAPIAHGEPQAMMQAMNDSLEAMARKHMEQWFWIHRRWKPERQKQQAEERAALEDGRAAAGG